MTTTSKPPAKYSGVKRVQVAQHYITTELGRILGDNNQSLRQQIQKSIANLPDKEIWRLLEALSDAYRLNSAFRIISDTAMEWQESEIAIASITLTRTSPQIDRIVYSEEISQRPLAFADYLRLHNQTKTAFEEFAPRVPKLENIKIITYQQGGQVKIVDGMHRLVAIALLGEESIVSYHGTSNPAKHHQSMVGDSKINSLKQLYLRASDTRDKSAVLRVVELLAKDSLDGASAIKEYWVDRIAKDNDRVTSAGEDLLKTLEGKLKP